MTDEAKKKPVLLVRAKGDAMGFYGNRRHFGPDHANAARYDPELNPGGRGGKPFILRDAKHFSHRWMEAIGWTPAGAEEPPATMPDVAKAIEDAEAEDRMTQPGLAEDLDPRKPKKAEVVDISAAAKARAAKRAAAEKPPPVVKSVI